MTVQITMREDRRVLSAQPQTRQAPRARLLLSLTRIVDVPNQRARPLSRTSHPGAIRSRMENAEAGSSTAHEIRITNHGKMTNWVTFALEHFKVRLTRRTRRMDDLWDLR